MIRNNGDGLKCARNVDSLAKATLALLLTGTTTMHLLSPNQTLLWEDPLDTSEAIDDATANRHHYPNAKCTCTSRERRRYPPSRFNARRSHRRALARYCFRPENKKATRPFPRRNLPPKSHGQIIIIIIREPEYAKRSVPTNPARSVTTMMMMTLGEKKAATILFRTRQARQVSRRRPKSWPRRTCCTTKSTHTYGNSDDDSPRRSNSFYETGTKCCRKSVWNKMIWCWRISIWQCNDEGLTRKFGTNVTI